MMRLIASFRARDGHEATVKDLLAEYAEVVRSTDGTVLFEPSTASTCSRDFVVFEHYRDEAAFRAHLAARENAAFNASLKEHVEADVLLQFLDPVVRQPRTSGHELTAAGDRRNGGDTEQGESVG
jgi:quinol monooxygenase YgiN